MHLIDTPDQQGLGNSGMGGIVKLQQNFNHGAPLRVFNLGIHPRDATGGAGSHIPLLKNAVTRVYTHF